MRGPMGKYGILTVCLSFLFWHQSSPTCSTYQSDTTENNWKQLMILFCSWHSAFWWCWTQWHGFISWCLQFQHLYT